MLKKLLLYSCLVLMVFGLTSANQEKQDILPADSYKMQVARQVFDQLIAAKGDKRLQVPEFIMSKRQRYVAWMNGKKSQIGLEEKAYDICVSYGADSLNAIAALLGHEIIHYYEKHNWGSEFASAYTDVEIASDIKSNTKTKEIKAVNETEADYLGGFLAHSAGYKTFGLMPKFLNDVYEAYGLGEDIPGYPSLSDRAKLAVEAESRLEDLVGVYQLANHMVVLDQNEDADVYYGYVLKEFQSREIYNNAGVNQIIKGLAMLPEDHYAKKFDYPIQLDSESRMMEVKARGDNLGFTADDQKLFDETIRKAIAYFEQAKALDGDYGTALVNLACAYDLIKEHEDAMYWARKAKKIGRSNSNDKVMGDAEIIYALATINDGEKEEGIEKLDDVSAKYNASSTLAKVNKAIAETGTRPMAEEASDEKVSLKGEKIEGFDLTGFLDELDIDKQIEINGNYTFAIKKLENSKVLLNSVDAERGLVIQLTDDNFDGTTGMGFSVGTDKATFIAKYGAPGYIRQTRKGEYLVYKKRKAIFLLNDGKLSSWAIYRTF